MTRPVGANEFAQRHRSVKSSQALGDLRCSACEVTRRIHGLTDALEGPAALLGLARRQHRSTRAGVRCISSLPLRIEARAWPWVRIIS